MHRTPEELSRHPWQPRGLTESCRQGEQASSPRVSSALTQQAVGCKAVADSEVAVMMSAAATPRPNVLPNHANALIPTQIPQKEEGMLAAAAEVQA